ncbi:S-methyl-5-thioribose kinase [Sediminispirochaeta smaragdinae]|uniref:S-methyl-5-thioribose kinase n=1 Tax=Sediminispirochaeta smaragdinae (strain DSM 11293 / JCM 15392 / SEBR 4228) TaxID=573413 RepID=E1R1Y3_SEDSS|nr:S-methyl-5-thioribose kinase [Sediminispirochaeta smaragdinae]ADK81509.1 5-methylthioribose kinase [Sediminispirochaeta smaragdinae DSM 11293]
MNKDYAKHFLMKAEDVMACTIDLVHYFEPGARLSCREIGDGNINYVFVVTDEDTGRSIVVKQADKFVRSSGRPLNLNHNKIEADVLSIEGACAPSMVPKIYYYDEVMCALYMEDISAYKNLRKEMVQGKIFPKLAEDISTFMADTLLPSTDLVLDRATKKERVKKFTNAELCDITEDLVLTEPYYDYKKRNIITAGNEEFVEKHLYQNEDLKSEVGILRDEFMNHAQALVHGDLHSGSIFVNEEGLKVIDPEFAYYGPIGYDIGNVIGNMFFAWAHKAYVHPENTEFIHWAKTAITEIVALTKAKLEKKFDEIVSFPLYNAKFKEHYLANIWSDSFGYAGTEMIRRVVGDAKVQELNDVTDPVLKIPMERALIATGIQLIMRRAALATGSELVEIFEDVMEAY